MELIVQKFLTNVLELALYRLSQQSLSRPLKSRFEQWIEALRRAITETDIAQVIARAIEGMGDLSKFLAQSLAAELNAVVPLQEDALAAARRSSMAASTEWDTNRRVNAKIKRACSASHSLLGSLREVVDGLPVWARGILKVGEELLEIYGPTR